MSYAEYQYNTNGLRTKKTLNHETTNFTWDGTNLAKEQTGDITNIYNYDITGIHSASMNGSLSIYIKDTHGNVIGVTDDTGVIVNNYEYDAFGVQISGDSAPSPFGYCGEYLDNESGLIYLRNRYYNSETGRFITEDSIKDGLNWYIYCGNNPVSFVDLEGLEYIVVSGGKYNTSRESGKYNYEFIETAIKKLRELKALDDGEGITWMITADGWSGEEKQRFYDVANEIGVGIHWTENKDDFINYINNKSDGNRASDKIHKFVVFSHGYDLEHGGGEHGTMVLGADINITVDDINNRLWASAFDNPNTALYSCSLGTYGDNSFAQAWVNKFGGQTWAFIGKSYYGDINQPTAAHPAIWASRQLHGFSYWGSAHYPIADSDRVIDGPYKNQPASFAYFLRKE
jgi:RHS repeat-associated protein